MDMEPQPSSGGTTAIPPWIHDGDVGYSPMEVTYMNWQLLQELLDAQQKAQY
jgi:hypothetical protein